MGTPENIAKLYKHRGTPKVYLTQELFNFYLRTLFFFFGIIIFINIIVAVFQFFSIVWWEVLGGMFSGIWIGCLIAAIVITIVFVYFSMEGFLPEDFGIIPKRLAIIFPFTFTEESMSKTREYTKQFIAEASMLGREKLAAAKARVEESKVIRDVKQKLEDAKQKRLIKKTQPVTIGELIFGASAEIIFGLLLIIQPFSVTVLMLPAFLNWLKLLGFLIFVSGLFDLIRLVIGVRNYTGQQVFLIIGAIYNISYILMFLSLLNQPGIFPISLFSGGNITIIPSDPSNITYIVYFWVIIVIIIGIIGGMIWKFVKVYRYSELKKAS